MGTANILTDRLVLRGWVSDDREPFAVMNADPKVMEHFPSVLNRGESDELVDRVVEDFEAHGFGLWALEVRENGRFIGFTGLSVPAFEASFTPAVEVGWRLAPGTWGKGYATEAATAALEFAFSRAGLEEVVSFTSVENTRSHTVMQRLGMPHDQNDDFEHPRIEVGQRLRAHVVYRISRPGWRARAAGYL